MGPAKRRQLVKMARLYLAEKEVSEERPCRFDVVEMEALPDGKWNANVIRDAFDAS